AMAQFVCRARRNDGGVWRDIVDDADRASRYQHAERFADESAYLAKMLRGETAHDEIEARIGKRKILGIGSQSFDIGEAAGLGKLARCGKHLRGEVGGGNQGDMRG